MQNRERISTMYAMTDEEFEAAVADAADEIYDEFGEELENVVFLVADEPTDEQLDCLDEELDDGWEVSGLFTEDGDLLGLYDGVALTERGDSYGGGTDYPDTITIFKGPHERLEGDREEILAEVRATVIHEVAHYFGMDEEQVDEMGYA